MNNKVLNVFNAYPEHVHVKMYQLRQLIYDVAAHSPEVGQLEETLKWGEPAYLTSKSKSGTTIRIDWKHKAPDHYGMYVNCKTSLVERYRTLFPELCYQDNRAILFDIKDELPEKELRVCIEMALKYHLNKA